MKQNKQMNIKDKLAHCLVEADFGGMNITILDYGAVEDLLEKLLSQTRQEAVEEVLEEVIKYLEEMEIVLTPEQSGKHNYDQMENEYFKGRNIGILRCIDLLKSLSKEKK